MAQVLACGFMLASPAAPLWAGSGSCPGTGAIVVADDRDSECGLDAGDALWVQSTGSVTGADVSASVGVRIEGAATGVEITNDGLISGGNSDGIWNFGSVTRITNSGQLQGGGPFSVGLYNEGSIGEFRNEATGVVTGSGAQIYAIESYGTLTTLHNEGLIAGGVRLFFGTTLNLAGTQARITGPVVNVGGTVNFMTGAVFQTENSFRAENYRIEPGARLVVTNAAHTLLAEAASADAFLNAGVLEVGRNTEAVIQGNYTQTGTLRVGVGDATDFGRLRVDGHAVLTSDASIDVNVALMNTLAAGESLDGVVVATESLTNNLLANAVTDNSELFNFRAFTSGSQVDILIEAAGTVSPPGDEVDVPAPPVPRPPAQPAEPEPQGIVPIVIQAGLLNGVPVARVLDGHIRAGRTGTDWDAVVTALGQLPDKPSVARAVGQVMPFLHGNAALAVMAHGAATGAALEQQQAQSTAASGGQMPGIGLWVKPLGAWVEQDRFKQVSGYKARTHGLVGGVQSELAPGSTLGFGLAYLDGRIEGKDFALGHRSDLESLQLIGYGAYDLSGWRLQWQADATRSSVKSQRWLGFIGRAALGSYHGNTWHLGMNLGKPMHVAASTVTPSIGIDWRQLRSGAYSESGAGALDLRVDAQKAQELVVKLGVQTLHPVGPATQVTAHAALGYDLASGSNAVTAQFAGGGPVFRTDGLPRRRAVAELGFGIRHRPSDALEIKLNYDLLLREGMTDQGASLRLDWRF